METTMNTNNNVMNNTELNATKRTDIYQIDPRNIVVVNGFNARRDFATDELKEQIREYGMLVPITVVPFKDEEGNEKYRLVDGERRYRVVMELLEEGVEIKRIKAMYLPKYTKEEELYIQQMIKNEGKAFTLYEQAIFFNTFKEKFGYTQNEIADKFKKKASFVSRCLSLLDLAPEIQEKLSKGEISTDAVQNIVSQNKNDEKAQIQAVEKAVSEAKAKGKKTATTKDIDNPTQVANLIVRMRKDMQKLNMLLDNIGTESALNMKAYFTELYNQTSEFEYNAQHLNDTEETTNEFENVA